MVTVLQHPGDLVFVGNGSEIPADMRILWASNDCQIEMGSLTGETEPLGRSSADETSNDTLPIEAKNLVFTNFSSKQIYFLNFISF